MILKSGGVLTKWVENTVLHIIAETKSGELAHSAAKLRFDTGRHVYDETQDK